MVDMFRPTRRSVQRRDTLGGASILMFPVAWLVRSASYATGLMAGTAMRLIIGSGISRRHRLRNAAEMYPMHQPNRFNPRGGHFPMNPRPADRRRTLCQAVTGSSRQLIVAALGLPPTVADNRPSPIAHRMNLWHADTWYYPLDEKTGSVMAIAFESNIARRVDVVDLHKV